MLEPIKKWYKRVMHWARTEKALAMISFAESSFFPIPPDPILLNMVLHSPSKWKRLALITSVTSVAGGLVGYLIGIALFESVGGWIIDTYHLQERFDKLAELFTESGALAVFAAALTPIPYKIFTITAGAFKLNFFVFLIASILGRSIRFYAVAYAGSKFGAKYEKEIGKYIDMISLGIIGAVVVLLVIVSLIA